MARIFIVDDDRDFLELQERILASQGYRVTSFTDPETALPRFGPRSRALPGLVVTDLMMSALDSGFTLRRAMKAEPRLARHPGDHRLRGVTARRGSISGPRTRRGPGRHERGGVLRQARIAPGASLPG